MPTKPKKIYAHCIISDESDKTLFETTENSAEKLLDELIMFVYPEEEKKDGLEENNEDDNNLS